MKSKLRYKLIELYESKGYEHVVATAFDMLKSRLHKDDEKFRIELHGEISEVILEISIIKYLKDNNITDYRLSKGLILKDTSSNGNKEFSTECDLTLFTTQSIITFECKSYSGNVELKGLGTVYREGKKYRDVWAQNKLHKETLFNNFHSAYKGLPSMRDNNPGIKTVFFSMANGKLVDSRSDKSKKAMPALECKDVQSYLKDVLSTKQVKWNMVIVNKFLDIIEKNNSNRVDKHINYVKSLHK